MCWRLPKLSSSSVKADSIVDMNKYLSAAGAEWDSGPEAGMWIGPLLDEFGESLGHAVPPIYGEYAVIPIPQDKDEVELYDFSVLESLVELLAVFTGDQAVHTALWEGWGYLYDHDQDPRTAARMITYTSGSGDLPPVPDWIVETRVARPNAAPLQLPHRNYYLWTGPLKSTLAIQIHGNIPSLIWPEDRSWFIGAPIYTDELAVGADERLIQAIISTPSMAEFGARRATRNDNLRIDGR